LQPTFDEDLMTEPLDTVRALMRRATGDEKHDTSAHSTLDVLWVLYDQVLRYDSAAPQWEGRDRFLLSKGHGPLALYAILAQRGFFAPKRLDALGSAGSILGAHPDRHLVPGVEISTGSLGHGLPMAVGVALGLRAKGGQQHVYVLVGDGECNEGSIWEAVMLAPHLRLANLTCIVVDNRSSSIDLGDIAAKFAAFGWAARSVQSHDHSALAAALLARDVACPTAVVVRMP
jgi:transketolase